MNVHPSVRSLIVVATLMLNSVATAAPSLAPTDLRCEFRTNPLGLGETAPRLSWRLEAGDRSARGLRQSAWQVRVAATAEALAAGRADGWDTGKISSDASNNIVYAGRPLKSRDTCFWQVRVWDQAGEASAWSAPASWTIGLLGAAEWQADWIGLDATARLFAGEALYFDVRLSLKKEDVPSLKLGDWGGGDGPRLGWNTWIGNLPAVEDKNDTLLSCDRIA